jgi:hypothetical protein
MRSVERRPRISLLATGPFDLGPKRVPRWGAAVPGTRSDVYVQLRRWPADAQIRLSGGLLRRAERAPQVPLFVGQVLVNKPEHDERGEWDMTRVTAYPTYVWLYETALWGVSDELEDPRAFADRVAAYRRFHAARDRETAARNRQREQEDATIAEAERRHAERRRAGKLAWAHTLLEDEDASPRGRRAIPREVRLLVWERDNGRCVDCGADRLLQFDHIIPLALGGSNNVTNLQLLCDDCNRRKGATLD